MLSEGKIYRRKTRYIYHLIIRATGKISTKLITKNHWEKGIQVSSGNNNVRKELVLI